jgi:predicted MarR family transcription regulator
MVKKKAPRGIGKIPVRMDSASIEEQTIERVNRTMSTLGNFLSRWDAAGRKPEVLSPQVARIKRFYDALGGWQKTALRAKGKDTGRVQRLRDFVLICRMYS